MWFRSISLSLFVSIVFLPLVAPLQLGGGSIALAQQIFRENQRLEANRLSRQGVEQFNNGQIQAALETFQQELALRQEIDDRTGEGIAIVSIGVVSNQLGQYNQALDYYQQALVIYKEVNDPVREGLVLNRLGLVYTNLGQYNQALDYYQQALVILRKENNRDGEGTILNNLGFVYDDLGQYSQALDSYQQSLAINREMGDRHGEGRVLNNIGLVYANLGHYSQALTYYQQALVINQALGDRESEGAAFNNIGLVYYKLGQPLQALDYYRKALVISQETSDRAREGINFNNIGEAYRSSRQYSQALDYYRQALVISREIGDRYRESSILNNTGLIHHTLGQYSQALNSFQQALVIFKTIGVRSGEGVSLINIGGVYDSLGQYPKALEYYHQALVIVVEIGDRDSEGVTLNNIGSLFFIAGDHAKATETLLDAVEAQESLRSGLTDADKLELLETQTKGYQVLQLALIVQNQVDEALVTSERGRNRAFIEQLAQRLEPQTAEELVTRNLPSLDRLKAIATTQNATLVEYSLVYDRQLKTPDAQLYIWIVKPTGEIQFQQTDLSTLDTPLKDLVVNARESIGIRSTVGVQPRDPQQSTIEQTQKLQQLHQLLIEPIAQHLPTDPNAPVVFVPQGALFSVPFAALQDSEGRSLIEKHTILTSPSIQLLEKTRQQRDTVQRANLSDRLIVGNPTMPRVAIDGDPVRQLDPLQGSQREAEAIAQLFNTQALIGNQATKNTVMQRMANARVIHLATHGLLNDRNGLDSAIALAPNGTGEFNDGLLTAAEIVQMKLNAELVVLSACDTGQGRVTGDGVIGLSRSLIIAGTPSVLVSLWAVPDAPTAELMTEFYHQWQKTGNKAQALRQAMLAIKEKYPNPRNWAGFTLMGEAE